MNEELNETSVAEEEQPKVENEPVTSLDDIPAEDFVKAMPKRKFFVDSAFFTFFAVFGVFWFTFVYIFQVLMVPIRVIGTSMQPSINMSVVSETDEDHCDIVYYMEHDKYKYGDTVIINNTKKQYINDDDAQYLIKRVIATPGQSVKFIPVPESSTIGKYTYTVEVYSKHNAQGKKLSSGNSYAKETMQFYSYEHYAYCDKYPFFKQIFGSFVGLDLTFTEDYYIVNVPKNEYFIMGDNRNNSIDSRFFGTVKKSDINGSVALQIKYGQNLLEAIWLKIKSAF